MKPERLLDVGPALFSGYRVALMTGLRCDGQALFETANDVAAAAALLGVAVLTSDDAIVRACQALGVATALPPPCGRKRCCCSEATGDRPQGIVSESQSRSVPCLLFPVPYGGPMTEAPSHIISLGRGRVKVLRLACDGLGLIHPLRYVVGRHAHHCRICGCTTKRGCIGGCAWANSKRTLCTRCAERIGR